MFGPDEILRVSEVAGTAESESEDATYRYESVIRGVGSVGQESVRTFDYKGKEYCFFLSERGLYATDGNSVDFLGRDILPAFGGAPRFGVPKVQVDWLEEARIAYCKRLNEIQVYVPVMLENTGNAEVGPLSIHLPASPQPVPLVGFSYVSMWMSGLWNPTRVSGRTYAKFGPKMREYRYVGMWAGPPNFDGVFDVEDFSTGLVRFGDQATLEFMITWACNAQDEAYIELLGDKGGARVFDGKPMTLLTEHNGRLADIQPKFDEKSDNFKKQAAAFLAACRGEAPPAATALEGVTIMKLIDSIYASSQLGREIEIT
jgi:hypothetical protein